MSLLSAISNKFHRRRKSHGDDSRNESRSKSSESSRSRGRSKSPVARAMKLNEEVREKSGLFALNHIDAASDAVVE